MHKIINYVICLNLNYNTAEQINVIRYLKYILNYIFRVKALCEPLLTKINLQAFWVALFVLIITILLFIITIIKNDLSKLTVHSCISIQSLDKLLILFCSTLLVLIMYYIYGLNYPLFRSSISFRVDCIFHTTLSTITLLEPSSTLVLLTVIHYRAVFWAKFNYKLEVKHILRLLLLVWIASLILVVLWTTLHGPYSSWYCLPFTSKFSWMSIVFQAIISILSVASLGVFMGCYCRMMTHLYREEHIIQAMRSRKISITRTLAIRFAVTFLCHFAQNFLLNAMMWLPLCGYNDQTVALANVMYVITVAFSDVYVHTYMTLKSSLIKWVQLKKK